MNDRIKTLYDQAHERKPVIIIDHETGNLIQATGHVGKPMYHGVFNPEKFATLIVKEMCGIMEQCEDDLYSIDASERPNEYIEWLYEWRTRFEKLFGVEE